MGCWLIRYLQKVWGARSGLGLEPWESVVAWCCSAILGCSDFYKLILRTCFKVFFRFLFVYGSQKKSAWLAGLNVAWGAVVWDDQGAVQEGAGSEGRPGGSATNFFFHDRGGILAHRGLVYHLRKSINTIRILKVLVVQELFYELRITLTGETWAFLN